MLGFSVIGGENATFTVFGEAPTAAQGSPRKVLPSAAAETRRLSVARAAVIVSTADKLPHRVTARSTGVASVWIGSPLGLGCRR